MGLTLTSELEHEEEDEADSSKTMHLLWTAVAQRRGEMLKKPMEEGVNGEGGVDDEWLCWRRWF